MAGFEAETEIHCISPVVVEMPDQNIQTEISVVFNKIPEGMAPRRWIFTLATGQRQEEMNEDMRLYLQSQGNTFGVGDNENLKDFHAELSASDAKLILTEDILTPIANVPGDMGEQPNNISSHQSNLKIKNQV